MKSELLRASEIIHALSIGPKEALALAVINDMGSSAQASDVHSALGGTKSSSRAVISVLIKKGLVRIIENPRGFSFYGVTPKAKRLISNALK